jgi:hypothetical protein
MGREKKGGSRPVPGTNAKDRHRRDRRGNPIDWAQPVPAGLVARREPPKLKSSHHTYFELVENTDKKKKLEFEVHSVLEALPTISAVEEREAHAYILTVDHHHSQTTARL